MCKIFAPNFSDKELALASQDAVSYFFFHQGFFYQIQHDCRAQPKLNFLFPPLKIKLKGRRFDTNEMIEAESLAVLNNLTEHFQDAFKKVAEAL
jgi:hypothetical protein